MSHFSPELHALLAELESFGSTHDAGEPQRAKKMLNLDRATAEVVDLLLRLGSRRSILEIGTSNGYSTIWLALAAAANDGSVVSIDRSAEKQAMARANLERANVLDRVTLRCGDATELIRSLAGTFDAVLFDADRVTATEQLELLLPRLSGDALVLTDNVLSHPAEVAAYLADVQRRPEFISVVIPVGKGLHVAYRLRG